MDQRDSVLECENVIEILDLKNLTTYVPCMDESIDERTIDLFNMTSLNNLIFLNKNDIKPVSNDAEYDDERYRLSLAYERLHLMPKILIQELAPHIKHLDLSYNEFDNLDFLEEFTELTSLICDHNNISCRTILPHMPNLELLWMNHCKIINLYPWIRNLQDSCPNLKYLSLMGNMAAPSYLNGGNFYEYIQYRLYVISLFPKLIHLDDTIVTEDQREEAYRIYKRPLLDRVFPSKNIPDYIRTVSDKMSNVLWHIQPSLTMKNNII